MTLSVSRVLMCTLFVMPALPARAELASRMTAFVVTKGADGVERRTRAT